MSHSPRLLAHRGMVSELAAENTLTSFQYAIDAGADAIETDVRCTKDGVAVLVHDKDFRRTANRNSKIAKLTYEEARQIPLTGGSHIVSLRDALQWFPEANFNIDVKSRDAIAATADAVNSTSSWNRVLITSFSNSRRVKTIKGMENQVKTSPGALLVFLIYFLAILPGSRLLKLSLQNLTALQIPVRFGLLRFDSRKFVSKISNLGVQVHFWVVNEVIQARKLFANGADAVVTDNLIELREALKS